MSQHKPKTYILSLGCAKNQVNSEQMAHILFASGYDEASCPEQAEVVIVNTCGFIESAKQEAIDELLRMSELKTTGKLKYLIAAGCLSERYKSELRAGLPEVDACIGVGSYGAVAEVVDGLLSGDGTQTERFSPPESYDDNAPRRILGKNPAWAYIKIAEGCDNKCAFCAIPQIRGKMRSRELEDIVAEAENLAKSGVRELVVIAQDTTKYGQDLYGRPSLDRLLRRLNEITELRWIRVHYMYPELVTRGLLDTFSEGEKLLPYFDIPLQHVSAKVLKKMRRVGNFSSHYNLVQEIRSRLPRAVIRTSFITGLPYEQRQEFEELLSFVRLAKLEHAGVFQYSPEEGTESSLMKAPAPYTARRRKEAIERLQDAVTGSFHEGRVGQTETVIIEECEDGLYLARSYAEAPEVDGYIYVSSENALSPGDFAEVLITKNDGGILFAETVRVL
ncbi:MAG: 30S ribosomal protein S12 methylthiotransferase RimO [Oscillospiraceae bacterium]|jgi:ribosomal protein S12 methylthiotransferase|nr:30S ribosomal protein S12 methylthiotransferase RimO [Oscillospiraceae bacterium]